VAPTPTGSGTNDWRRYVGPKTWGAPVVVLLVGLAVTSLLWTPLSWPARTLNTMVTTVFEAVTPWTVTNCIEHTVGTWQMGVCSAVVGLFAVMGPLLIVLIMFVFRRQVTGAMKGGLAKVPPAIAYVVAPLIAVIIFTIGWAGVHFETEFLVGFVSNRHFPGFIGLFTYVTVQWGGWIHARITGALALRDRIPMWGRFVLTFAVPLALGIMLTRQDRVTDVAMKEQFVVVVAVAAGWFLLAPRMDRKGAAAIGQALDTAVGRRRGAGTR